MPDPLSSRRFSGGLRSRAAPAATPASAPAEVFRRFFDLIARLERGRRPGHPPAPELKARISRLDETSRRQG